MLRVFEAFSGIGTQSMALNKLGIDFKTVAISEVDKYAIKSYNAIHGDTLNLGDISKVDIEEVPDHDLFTYSFPCQDISLAGKQQGFSKESGTRSSLLWEANRIIEGYRPKYLLLENVKNLVSKKFIEDFEEWIKHLDELGYTTYWKVLNSKDYGVPQNRERVFAVSILGDHVPFHFPEPVELVTRLKDLLEESVSEKFYLDKERTDKLTFKEVSGFPDKVQRVAGIFDTETSRHQAGATFSPNGIAPTLDTMQGGWRQPSILTDEGRVRRLTPLECWRLMGCTDEDFYKAQEVNSNTQLYKQSGNAIVVNVLEGIFRNLLITQKISDVETIHAF